MVHHVVFLPGGVLPAGPAYANLIKELGAGVEALAKDLEVYRADAPPQGYSLGDEVAGLMRFADASGFARFHLVGYSGGGAASLMFAATYPERLQSLVLMEPAWAGNAGLAPEEDAVRAAFRNLSDHPGPNFMAGFTRLQLAPGVAPPPPPGGPPPPWMARRPAGLRAMMAAFDHDHLDLGKLRSFAGPVVFVLGGRSNQDYYGRMAARLGHIFRNYRVETFPERHHFDPPHRIEPKRVAAILNEVWTSAEHA